METYQVGVKLEDPKRPEDVIAAFRTAMRWNFEEETGVERWPNALFLVSVFELENSDDDLEEFIETLSAILWRANGEFCPLEMKFIALSEVPHHSVEMGKEAWGKIMGRGN